MKKKLELQAVLVQEHRSSAMGCRHSHEHLNCCSKNLPQDINIQDISSENTEYEVPKSIGTGKSLQSIRLNSYQGCILDLVTASTSVIFILVAMLQDLISELSRFIIIFIIAMEIR